MAWIECNAPKPDENTTEITMGDWRVSDGDAVRVGDPLCEMIAGKGAFEYLALDDGTLTRQLLTPGSVVPVGYVFALMETSATPSVGCLDEIIENIERKNRSLIESLQSALTGAPSAPVRATPAARRLAKEKGIDLSVVKAALGIDGAVTPDDITDYLSR